MESSPSERALSGSEIFALRRKKVLSEQTSLSVIQVAIGQAR